MLAQTAYKRPRTNAKKYTGPLQKQLLTDILKNGAKTFIQRTKQNGAKTACLKLIKEGDKIVTSILDPLGKILSKRIKLQ